MIVENEKRICTLISKVERKFGMYIGEKSLTYLSHFLNGYRFRFFEESQYLFLFQSEFQRYIETKHHQEGTVYAWNDIILNQNGLQEDVAFDAFFRLFNLFLKETAYGNLILGTASDD